VHRGEFSCWGKLGKDHMKMVDILVFSTVDANVLTPDAVVPHTLVNIYCCSGKFNGGFVNERPDISVGVAAVDVGSWKASVEVVFVPRVNSLVVVFIVVPGDTVRKSAVVAARIDALATSTGLVAPKGVQADLFSKPTRIASHAEAATNNG
jgi:hypothetical protein